MRFEPAPPQATGSLSGEDLPVGQYAFDRRIFGRLTAHFQFTITATCRSHWVE